MGFEEMNRRDADERRGELDLKHARIHVGEPLWLVRMFLEAQARDKCFVAADDYHDEEIGNHDHIDKSQHREHDRFFVDVRSLLKKVSQLDEEMVYIDALGYDQSEVKRSLKPAAKKDQTGKSAMVSCWWS